MSGSEKIASLTEREYECLAILAKTGCLNNELAETLRVSTDTVHTHLNHIYGKLDVSGRVQAMVVFRNWGAELVKEGL